MKIFARNAILLAALLAILFAPGYLAAVYGWAWGLKAGVLTRILALAAACYGPGFALVYLMKGRRFYKAVIAVVYGVMVTFLLLPYLF